MRVLKYGVGVYDSDDLQSTSKDYVRTKNPVYTRWEAMLNRCYGKESLRTNFKAEVCGEWLYYSNFKKWMLAQQWEGSLYLDKDILSFDNKIYSPETCAFVPAYINALLNSRVADRGEFPLGVTRRKKGKDMINEYHNGYIASISKWGNQCLTTVSNCPLKAHKSWQLAKSSYIQEVVAVYAEETFFRTDVAEALILRSWRLNNDAFHNVETKTL